MRGLYTALATDLLTVSITLVLVWSAFSLIDIHDSVMTEDHGEQMLASAESH